MNYYRCPTCGTVFSEAELTTMKCSENYVGPEFSDICPKCLNRRKNKRFSRVKKIEDMNSLRNKTGCTISKFFEMTFDIREQLDTIKKE